MRTRRVRMSGSSYCGAQVRAGIGTAVVHPRGILDHMPLGVHLPGQRLLYHYTSAGAAVDGILPTGQLRLGLFEFTNDPRESKQWRLSASVAISGVRRLMAGGLLQQFLRLDRWPCPQ